MKKLTFGNLIAQHIQEQIEETNPDAAIQAQTLGLYDTLGVHIQVALDDLKKSGLMQAVWIQ